MPTLHTVPVTCKAFDQNGNPVVDGRFVARLNTPEIYQGFVVPEEAEAYTDVNGTCVLNLWPNALGVAGSGYLMKAWNPDTGKIFLNGLAVVPDQACNLESILTIEPYPEINAAQQALIASQSALAEVTAMVDDAAASQVASAASEAAAEADRVASLASQLAAANSAAEAAYSAGRIDLGALDTAVAVSTANQVSASADAATATAMATTSTTMRNQAVAAEAQADAARDEAVTMGTAAVAAAASATASQTASAASALQAAGSATVASASEVAAELAETAAEAANATAQTAATTATTQAAAGVVSAAAALASQTSATASAGVATTQAAASAASATAANTSAGTATAQAGSATASAATATTQAAAAVVSATTATNQNTLATAARVAAEAASVSAVAAASAADLDATAAEMAKTAAEAAETAAESARDTAVSASTAGAGGVLSGNFPNPGFAVDMATQGELNTHTADVANPHVVTKAQVGLSAADNTSDVNKPVSTAAQTALDGKASLTGATMTGHLTVPAAAAGSQAPRASEVGGLAVTQRAVGVVSQVAGVPTGAIVETGTNANGTYIRYADGTQICYFVEAATRAITSAVGSSFLSAGITGTFAAAFIAAPVMVGFVQNSSGGASAWASNSVPTAAGFTAAYMMAPLNTVIARFGYTAIGRWF